jgi:hypothetical protein
MLAASSELRIINLIRLDRSSEIHNAIQTTLDSQILRFLPAVIGPSNAP